MDVDVTLEQLYDGDFIEIMRAKPVTKQTKGTRECNCKNVMQTVKVGNGRFQMQQQRKCSRCPNIEIVTEYKELDVEVEIGMQDGQEIVFHGEGEPHLDGESGSLTFKINCLTHPRFQRRGMDLFTNVSVSLRKSLLGFKVEIRHLDGHKVQIGRSEITPPGTRIVVKGEGMKSFDNNLERGNLYVTYLVEFPHGQVADTASVDKILPKAKAAKTTQFNGMHASFVPPQHQTAFLR